MSATNSRFSRPSRFFQRGSKGFTLIELLAVTVLIGVLTAIAVVAYISAGEGTRDARRKNDVGQLRLALETYRQATGAYPTVGAGCGTWAYSGCQSSGQWIIGLVPDYIPTLPNDPKQSGGSDLSQATQFAYKYQRLTPTTYYLITKLENTADAALNGTLYGMAANIYVVIEAK